MSAVTDDRGLELNLGSRRPAIDLVAEFETSLLAAGYPVRASWEVRGDGSFGIEFGEPALGHLRIAACAEPPPQTAVHIAIPRGDAHEWAITHHLHELNDELRNHGVTLTWRIDPTDEERS